MEKSRKILIRKVKIKNATVNCFIDVVLQAMEERAELERKILKGRYLKVYCKPDFNESKFDFIFDE